MTGRRVGAPPTFMASVEGTVSEAALMIVLRLVHIISGALWVGAVLFLAIYIVPIVRASGADGSRLLQGMEQRRFPLYMGALPGLAVLSGIGLYQRALSVSHDTFGRSHMGMALGLGGGLALIALIIGGAVAGRSAGALTKLDTQIQAAGGVPSAAQTQEILRLQAKLATGSKTVAVLVLITTALMAAARYL
ncbi:MAG: hypothetical protein ABI625_05930 [bacterium]